MRSISFLVLLAALLQPLITFSQLGVPRYIADGSGIPEFALTADINVDGELDIAYLAPRSGEIRWIAGEGNGMFGATQLALDVSDSLYSLVLGDLNSDGFPDFIAYNQVEEQVFWLPNQGDGSFGNPINLFASRLTGFMNPFYPQLLPADIDEDGDIDIISLIAPPTEAITLSWWENDGNGQFLQSYPIDYPSLLGPAALAWEDVDGDGKFDLLTQYSDMFSTDLIWFSNNGAGEFGEERIIEADNLNNPISKFTFDDLNDDGVNDIVVVAGQQPLVLINEGDGSFAPAYSLNTGSIASNTTTGDFDLDGDVDIAFIGFDFIPGNITNRLYIMRNDGTGSFTTEILAGVVNLNTQPLRTTDIDSDGLPDIVGLGQDMVWFKNLGDADFSTMIPIQPEILDPGNLAAADFNGDGLQDVVVLSEKSYQVSLFLNEGQTGFSPRQLMTINVDWPTGLATGDLDMDGDEDVLIGSFFGSEISWMSNNGNGQFAEPQVIDGTFHLFFYNSVEVATPDLNGDGRMDILAFQDRVTEPEIGWLANQGGSQFADFVLLCQNCYYWGVGDAENDGDQDILAYFPAVNDGELKWLLNDGTSNFSEELIIAQNITVRQAASADLDGQENPEVLVLLDSPAAGVVAFQYNGTGYTGSTVVSDAVEWMGVTDLDGDGLLDLVTRQNDGTLAWSVNEGSVSFTPSLPLGYLDFHSALFTDLSGDGAPDLLFADRLPGNRVGWMENQGTSYFTALCFWDENENGQRDPEEPGLRGLPLELSPTGQVAFTNEAGEARFYAASGDYELGFLPEECWELTTDSVNYHVSLLESLTEPFTFGFRTDGENEMEASITSAPTRCGFTVPFWISLHNTGCLYSEGRFALSLDADLLTFLEATPAPSSINGDTLFWDFGPLEPGGILVLELTNVVAGVDFLGETIAMQGITYLYNTSGDLLPADSTLFTSVINCAYDPNDKLVDQTSISFPADVTQNLNYTIRFQNTGTDTAFTVRLLDTLDAALDWSSFRPLGSSHPYEASLDPLNGIVEFVFRNILLPDSTSNEPASHGFASFAIQLQEGLPENQLIANRAGIYFDFNPPVLTNTVESVLERPVSVLYLPLDNLLDAKLYPNPSEGRVWLSFAEPLQEPAELSVLNVSGQSIFNAFLARGTRQYSIGMQTLPEGTYLVQLRQKNRSVWFGKVVRHRP